MKPDDVLGDASVRWLMAIRNPNSLRQWRNPLFPRSAHPEVSRLQDQLGPVAQLRFPKLLSRCFPPSLGFSARAGSFHRSKMSAASSPKGKQSKCPSADKWINNMAPAHMVQCYSATLKKEILTRATTWMNLEDIICEVSQSRKDGYGMIPLAWGTLTRKIQRQKNRAAVGKGWGWGCLMGTEVPSGKMETALGLKDGDSCTAAWMYFMSLSCTCKKG